MLFVGTQRILDGRPKESWCSPERGGGVDKTRASPKTARYSRQAIRRSKTCDPQTNGPAATYLADYGAQPVSDTGGQVELAYTTHPSAITYAARRGGKQTITFFLSPIPVDVYVFTYKIYLTRCRLRCDLYRRDAVCRLCGPAVHCVRFSTVYFSSTRRIIIVLSRND